LARVSERTIESYYDYDLYRECHSLNTAVLYLATL